MVVRNHLLASSSVQPRTLIIRSIPLKFGVIYPFPRFSWQPHLFLLLFDYTSTGFERSDSPLFSTLFGTSKQLPYPLSVLTLEWSRLKIYFRINTFLLKLPQEMSTTIVIHLHFTSILNTQPCTGTLFGQGLYKM